jgi:hypothetical protein
VDESEEQLDDEVNPYAADARRDRLKRKKKKRLNINAGEATLDPDKPPAKLTATLLERFVRIFVMLSQVSCHMAAHQACMKEAVSPVL